MKIESYEIISDEPIATSSAVYWKVEKNNEYFFLKRFNDPSRPSDRISQEEIKRKNDWCDRFEKKRKTINGIIRNLGGGNFVAPVDFFLYKKRYYQATPWREIKAETIQEIVQLNMEDKLMVLKTAANCVKLLHEKGIIHCDIKPDNLPVTRATSSKRPTCSLIDFDSAELEYDIAQPDEVCVTDPFMSPELASYKLKKNYYSNQKFTVKNDVFAMAIVFHYYWSGEKFSYPKPARGPYLYNAVLEDMPITVSNKIPEWLKHILLKMIDKQPENRPSMSEVLEYLKQVDLQQSVDNNSTPVSEDRVSETKEQEDNRYCKGIYFPEDATSFQVLPNGNVKFVYNDGSKIALNINVAIKRQYITENNGG